MMKKVLLYCVVSIMLFGYVLPTYSESPGDFPYSPSKYGVPETIGGYATLAVIPATSIPCALEGHLRLILKSESSDVKTFLNQSNGASFQEELQQLDITKSVVWDVSVVSPNTTESDIVFSVNELNRTHNGLCDKLGRIEIDTNSASKPIEVGVNNQEYKVGYSVNGYVVFENLDAASIPNDNAQAVTMNPPLPSIGSNQTADSYLLNNVLTNTGYFLQNGLEFKSNATGGVVYTSDAYGLAAQHYVSSII